MPDRERDELTRKRTPPEGRVRVRPRIGGSRWVRDTEGTGPPPEVGRAVLIILSVGGVVVCLYLWVNGHGYLALRVLAGDVILATVLLLVM